MPRPDRRRHPSPDVPAQSAVVVNNLVKQFRRNDGKVVKAIDHVSLEVARGEFVVLLGPSGCGKTTLLRSVAGLELPDTGQIQVAERTVFSSAERVNVPPERRRISMVFQSYALWPHMTVFRNVAYPLTAHHVKRAEIRDRVQRVLEMVGIADLARQHPGQISGGQQQRVALARALVSGDDLILFDEPLSNVDAKVREQLRFELVEMQKKVGFAALYVTHDQAEAMSLADRIAVLDSGRVAQFGPPREVYNSPANRYVAAFVGSSNEVPGIVEGHDPDLVRTALGLIRCRGDVTASVGTAVAAVFRPEQCLVTMSEPTSVNRWKGRLLAASFLGTHSELLVEIGAMRLVAWSPPHLTFETDADLWVSVDPSAVQVVQEVPLEDD